MSIQTVVLAYHGVEYSLTLRNYRLVDVVPAPPTLRVWVWLVRGAMDLRHWLYSPVLPRRAAPRNGLVSVH